MLITPSFLDGFKGISQNSAYFSRSVFHADFGSEERQRDLFLLITLLYHNEVINREKYIAMCNNNKAGKLNRKIKTHHCKINNKWYDDTGMYTILFEVFDDMRGRLKPIELEDFIKYANLYLNKPRNYCIDWIFYSYIEPVIEEYNRDTSYSIDESYRTSRAIDMLKVFNIQFPSCNLVHFYDFDGTNGYCCEDCDGDEGTYRASRYYYNNICPNRDNLRKDFSKFLNSKKTDAHLKNPKLIANNFIL